MPTYKDARGRWVVDFTSKGRRIYRRCEKGSTQAEAKAYEAKLRTDLRGQKFGLVPSVSLVAALQHHINKSIKGTASEGKAEASVYRLFEYAQGKTVEQAPECAESFVEAMRGRYSVASLNLSIAALRRSCTLAFKAGWTEHNYGNKISVLPGARKRRVWLTPDEVRYLAECAKYQRTKDVILLLAYTGMRLGELLSIRKGDVKSGIITVRTGKLDDDIRSIPVHPAVRDAAKRLPIQGAQRNVQQSFAWARKKAGMGHVRPHDLRHTFGSWLAQQEVQLPTIMELMGHKSAATAKRYLHLDATAKKKAIGRLV